MKTVGGQVWGGIKLHGDPVVFRSERSTEFHAQLEHDFMW